MSMEGDSSVWASVKGIDGLPVCLLGVDRTCLRRESILEESFGSIRLKVGSTLWNGRAGRKRMPATDSANAISNSGISRIYPSQIHSIEYPEAP